MLTHIPNPLIVFEELVKNLEWQIKSDILYKIKQYINSFHINSLLNHNHFIINIIKFIEKLNISEYILCL